MFHFIKIFFSNLKLNSALTEAGYNPEFFFDDVGYLGVSTLISQKLINKYEAASSLIAALDTINQTSKADEAIEKWMISGKLNEGCLNLAIKYRLYLINKSRDSFDGSFLDFCKENP